MEQDDNIQKAESNGLTNEHQHAYIFRTLYRDASLEILYLFVLGIIFTKERYVKNHFMVTIIKLLRFLNLT